MHPAVPDRPAHRRAWASAEDVGSFDQGSDLSRWALSRYLVGRVLLERLSATLLVLAVGLLVLAGVFEWVLHLGVLTVLAVLAALAVLLVRTLLRVVLHRLMGAGAFGVVEPQVRAIAKGAGPDVMAELRRVGLPGRRLTLPLLIPRLVGRRRAETFERIRRFDVERAVPRARRDELLLLLRRADAGPRGSAPFPSGPFGG